METLARMKCVACRKDAPTMTDAELAEFHPQVSDWEIVELDGIKRLRRVFSADDFAQALAFTTRVGELAEEEGHHPALLTEWGRTTITWWTHKIKGLHRNDFIMAAKTDELYHRSLGSEVEIAPRVEADLPQLFGLAKGTFAALPGWSDERVLEVLTRNLIFVAREEGQPAGYVAVSSEEGGVIVVEQLFVAPGHEQRGIGHRLLAYAEGYAIAERARSLQVVVEESNQQARSFYRRSGFVPVEPELFELILPSAD